MSLDLVNFARTTSRLNNQTSNSNVVESNILKLQTLSITIEEERRKLQHEKTELRKLKKQMDEEKSDLQTQKTNMQNQKEMIRHQLLKQKSIQSLSTEAKLQQRKQQRELQKKLDQVSKELTGTKRKLMSAQRKGNGDKEKRYKALERRYLAEKKNNKNLKRELDGTHSELAIAKRKLMTSQRKGTGGISNAKYKALLRKWMRQRKKLKLALLELDDRANFYRRQLGAFKKKQAKLLRQQKAMLKGKKEAVKYVFIDDMVSVKFHSKHKNKIKIITKKGKTILVENVKVIHEKGKKKKTKKKGQKQNNFAEDASWMEQNEIVQELLDNIDKEDGYESSFFQTETANYGIDVEDDEDDEDDFADLPVLRGDVMDWKQEMQKRNEDLKILMSIATSHNNNLNFDDLISGIVERNAMLFEEIDEKELEKDLETYEFDDFDEKTSVVGRKNQYDESMKLLKTNCDEYLIKLQDTITSLQSIVEKNDNNKQRVSIIKRKSMQSDSLLTPDLSHLSLSEWSASQISIFNPDSIVDEISTFYISELEERGKDIKLMHEIFYSLYTSDDKMTLVNLEEIVKGIDDRIDDIEDDDKFMVKFIGNMQNWKLQFQEHAVRQAMLIKELSERRNEIEQLFGVIDISGGNNKALMNRITTLSNNIDGRHQNIANIVDISRYETILGQDKNIDSYETNTDYFIDDNTEKQNNHYDFISILENVCGFHKENEEWRRFIAKLKAETEGRTDGKWKSTKISGGAASSKIIENCVKRSMQEITDRTQDVIELKLVLLSKDKETGGELLNTIEDRHNKLNEANNDIIKSHSTCIDYCVSIENNDSWWTAIEEIVVNNKIMKTRRDKGKQHEHKKSHDHQYESSSLSLMMPHTLSTPVMHTPIRTDTIKGLDYNENLKFVLTTGPTTTGNIRETVEVKKDDILEEELDEEWWLMLDEKRNKQIEGIAVTTEENNKLCKLAVFVSRILKFEATSNGDTGTLLSLYIPIDLNGYPSSQFRCLATLFDGVVISKLLCLINEDLIDFRAIHKPIAHDMHKAYPIAKYLINENVSVILSSLKSMGIILHKMYSIADWWDNNKHCELLINLLSEIASRTMDRFCSFKKHRELILLKKKKEPISSLTSFDGEKWIIRWMNYMLKRSGINNVDIDNESFIKNWNKDFMKILALLKKRNSVLLTNGANAKSFIKVAKTQFNVDTPIEAHDFTNNNRFCQNYFAAQIFDKMNGLKYITKDEDVKCDFDGFDEGEKDSILAWINSFGLRNRVDSLDDISSGITLLKVLDRLKKGSVPWNKVHLKVRHKFDHVINCNHVVNICSKQLGLKFVTTSGMDIVDKNTQIIKSILWRIMRYQSIKILSDLQFGSEISKVNNSEIVKWCNQKLLSTFKNKLRCKTIRKLKDLSLTNGIYYLELIRAIMPNAINDNLINVNIPPLSSSIKRDFNLHDKHYKKRKQNMKLTCTIIRRFGVDLFINVDDLFRLESRAVISILAALMTISLSSQQLHGQNKPIRKSKKIQPIKINNDKRKAKKNKKSIRQPKPKPKPKPNTPLKMENMDDIDIDSILDSIGY